MKIWHILFLSVAWSATGCAYLGPLHGIDGPVLVGETKAERPYLEGQWIGPIPIEIYEGALLEYYRAPERKLKPTKPTLIEQYYPKYWFPSVERWQALKRHFQPGDELWEFGAAPHWVDGGPRYFGVCLVRQGIIVAIVTTSKVGD